MVDGKKMSKSLGNFYTLRDLIEKGVDPIAFRYWLYTASYRTKINFTLEAVEGAQNALKTLSEIFLTLPKDGGSIDEAYKKELIEYMDDDLSTPRVIALMWKLVHDSNIKDSDRRATLLDFDKILGLNLSELKEEIIPIEIVSIAEEREQARKNKDWAKSDELRDKIKSLGYEVKDTDSGFKVSKI